MADLSKKETIELMEKLGIKVPTRITAGEAEARITSHLTDNEVDADVTFTEGERKYLERIGFELPPVQEEKTKTETTPDTAKETTKKESAKETKTRANSKQERMKALVFSFLQKEARTQQEIIDYVNQKLSDANENSTRAFISKAKRKDYGIFPNHILVQDDNKKISLKEI